MSYLALVSNSDSRKTDILPANTIIEASEGIFTINERPVHCGGNAILYNAHKEGSNLDYVLKEYFPYFFWIMRTHLANSMVKHFCINASLGKKISYTIPKSIVHNTVYRFFIQ